MLNLLSLKIVTTLLKRIGKYENFSKYSINRITKK